MSFAFSLVDSFLSNFSLVFFFFGFHSFMISERCVEPYIVLLSVFEHDISADHSQVLALNL